jgi:heptosyltransferase-1
MSRAVAGDSFFWRVMGGMDDTGLPDLGQARDVLIVKPSSLGDIVHTLPSAALLKQQWPQLMLRWVANTEWTALVEGSPLLSEVIAFPRRRFRGPMGGLRALPWLVQLGRRRPDVALDFQGLLRSALIARASRGRFIAGLSDAREGARFFYSHTVPVDAAAHAIDRCLALVRAFGATGDAPSVRDVIPAGDALNVDLPNRFILLHPIARGAGKSLTPLQIAQLTQALDAFPVVIAGVSSQPAPGVLPANVLDLTNRTSLSQLIWLIRRAAFVISVDSGPMHLANALERPLVGIHSWSDPRKVGPYDPAAWTWKGGKIVRRHEIDDALAARHEPPTESDLIAIAACAVRYLSE